MQVDAFVGQLAEIAKRLERLLGVIERLERARARRSPRVIAPDEEGNAQALGHPLAAPAPTRSSSRVSMAMRGVREVTRISRVRSASMTDLQSGTITRHFARTPCRSARAG